MECITAVSYTHLDVYKRQGHYRIIRPIPRLSLVSLSHPFFPVDRWLTLSTPPSFFGLATGSGVAIEGIKQRRLENSSRGALSHDHHRAAKLSLTIMKTTMITSSNKKNM